MVTNILSIDGNWLCRHIFEAVKFGEEDPVSACTLLCLGRIREKVWEFEPETVAVAWDSPPSEYVGRRKLIPGYKENRGPAPDGYNDALSQLKKVLKGKGAYQFSGPGEGDDVIATITKTMPGPHVMYSADKDLFQLVSEDCSFCRAVGSGFLYTAANIKDETGLSPDEWIEYQSLVGDSSDNVKGVPGIGDVWAKKIIDNYPGLVRRVIYNGSREEVQKEIGLLKDCALKKKLESVVENHRYLTEAWLAINLQVIELEAVLPEGGSF